MNFRFAYLIKCCSIFILLLIVSCKERHSTRTILVLAPLEHFGHFTAEILRTEGFNHFELDSITDNISLDYLAGFDVVILGQSEVSEQLASTLNDYVKEGGNLIAFRP